MRQPQARGLEAAETPEIDQPHPREPAHGADVVHRHRPVVVVAVEEARHLHLLLVDVGRGPGRLLDRLDRALAERPHHHDGERHRRRDPQPSRL